MGKAESMSVMRMPKQNACRSLAGDSLVAAVNLHFAFLEINPLVSIFGYRDGRHALLGGNQINMSSPLHGAFLPCVVMHCCFSGYVGGDLRTCGNWDQKEQSLM